MKKIIQETFETHIQLARKCVDELTDQIETAANVTIEGLKQGKKILFFGNGGSAADAQHLAAEFVGRFKRERRGLPAIACTTDSSILTAIGNDYGYDKVFLRQVEALANEGDIIVGISTSGNSESVLCALDYGKQHGCKTIGFLGRDGGAMKDVVDIPLIVNAPDTARVQEMHILIGHIICDIVEEAFAEQ